jgi:hypothetical protein
VQGEFVRTHIYILNELDVSDNVFAVLKSDFDVDDKTPDPPYDNNLNRTTGPTCVAVIVASGQILAVMVQELSK